jgi:tetratricopeptide (TPR) repeat protein
VTTQRAPLRARVRRWFWSELARWCQMFRQSATTLKYFGYALEAVPDDPKTIANIGFELARVGRKREALAQFDRAAELRPDWAELHFNRGFLLQELNDHAAALEAMDRAIALNPRHDRALYGKALSLIVLKRGDEAVAALEKNTRLQPMSPYGWYQLARVQFDRGESEKTQAIIDHLNRFEPKVAAQLARETGLRAPERP